MLVNLIAEAQHTLPNAMTNNGKDLALVQRLVAGEDAAMHELYAAYGQRLYAYALRLVNDPSQAEDVVQDALVVVWKSARKFRGDGRLLAWLLGITHHLAIKSLRHRSRLLTDEMEETLETRQPSPEQQAERSEQSERLQTSLRMLSLEHRAVLELVFYQGLSLDEVAQICHVPLGTVKSRLSYARRSLRGALTREGLEDVR
ncbi:MAG TPA: sigma-70 family RNA polymerase sigma factor [Anaerolineaceae bacterium]|nr:sigma-70 family RNA polymerase sigma factor [Anaerolineaceae bacterium]